MAPAVDPTYARIVHPESDDQSARQASSLHRWVGTAAIGMILGAVFLVFEAPTPPREAHSVASPVWLEADHSDWVSVEGGHDQACRDAGDGSGTEGKTFIVHSDVTSLADCKALCMARAGKDKPCRGVEFGESLHRCEVWIEAIGGTASAEGFQCVQHNHDDHHESRKPPVIEALQEEAKKQGKCTNRFLAPGKPGRADAYNGIALPEVCFNGDGPHHVFIIGDWGGITQHDGRVAAAPHLTHRWDTNYNFVWPPDERAQYLVRDQMRKRAPKSKPDYILNMGDNFYWAGVEDHCGAEDIAEPYSQGGTQLYKKNKVNQFKHIYEEFYTGEHLDGKQWLGILGNHDYGGWLYSHAWDQAIGYTWSSASYSTGRWFTPAMYYSVKVNYDDTSVDYFFMDTNVFDALDPENPSSHNICSKAHDPHRSCAPVGPKTVWNCQDWFDDLWEKQKVWLEKLVRKSTAHWRIVVTHFPPCWGSKEWKKLAKKHEIDLFITGHRHVQDMHAPGDKRKMVWHKDPNKLYNDFLDPSVWVISGGGGGVTSEHAPNLNGTDDQYGFMDLTITREELTIEGISHGGDLRRKLVMKPPYPHHPDYVPTTTTTTRKPKHKDNKDDHSDKKGTKEHEVDM